VAGGRGFRTAESSQGSFTGYEPGASGRRCLASLQQARPVTTGSPSGAGRACSTGSSRLQWPS